MKTEGLPSRLRVRRGNMHVRAAAAEIGISPTTLLKIECGGVPSMRTPRGSTCARNRQDAPLIPRIRGDNH